MPPKPEAKSESNTEPKSGFKPDDCITKREVGNDPEEHFAHQRSTGRVGIASSAAVSLAVPANSSAASRKPAASLTAKEQ
jgi:hypothetical protein